MTATKAPAVPYVSGWCGSGRHDYCRGSYGRTTCTCPHHDAPLPPPEVLGEIAAALTELGTAAAVETLELFHIDGAPAQPKES